MLSTQNAQAADLVIFPELFLTGYPPKDHVFESDFMQRCDQALKELAQKYSQQSFILGTITQSEDGVRCNSAVWIDQGQILASYQKALLPSYDVFFEPRYFKGRKQLFEPVSWKNYKVAISICEDFWFRDGKSSGKYETDPVIEQLEEGCDFLLNLSASPFEEGKSKNRKDLASYYAQKYQTPFLFCNMVGGNDDLIFDGQSFIMSAQGNIQGQAKSFSSDLLLCEFPLSSKEVSVTERDSIADVADALCLGVYDFVRKNQQSKVWIALSGGIDSACVAQLACRALGSKNVKLVFMPSKYTRQMSHDDAHLIAKNLGCSLDVIPISEAINTFEKLLENSFQPEATGTAEENIQARTRSLLLMALSNHHGGLVLSTGNKSEIAVGYCTLYGDMVGALNPLGDVWKSQVYRLSNYLNQTQVAIPDRVYTRAPSAELKEDQEDQDSLPSYEILDAILSLRIEKKYSASEIIAEGFSDETVSKVLDLVEKSEFKRSQSPIILKISSVAFGSGRLYPVARTSYED